MGDQIYDGFALSCFDNFVTTADVREKMLELFGEGKYLIIAIWQLASLN